MVIDLLAKADAEHYRSYRADYEAGFRAFPSGRYADALRGVKSFRERVRCPFRRAERVEAWQRGYDEAHRLMNEP